MTNDPTNAGQAEVSTIDAQARRPLLALSGTAILWLVLSGVFALIAAVQMHSPAFMTDCAWFTPGRVQAMRETAFVYGWAANAGLALALWILGRLGGHPLRGLNWALAGTGAWNVALAVGLAGIASGDMSGFALLQLPRYVHPVMVFAYAAIAMPGVLAWWGRRRDGTFAAQWYALAALFLFPWAFSASHALLFCLPVQGVVQAIGGAWYAQTALMLWLAPFALAVAYYVVPKVAGRALPSYEAAPLAFWTLMFIGTWTTGRHLVGGPVPAWVSTIAIVGHLLLLFHYLVVGINFRPIFGAGGLSLRFIRLGVIAYLLAGLLDAITALRGVAVHTHFTLMMVALRQLFLYVAVSLPIMGGIYYMVPRLTGRVWASAGLASGHFVALVLGLAASLAALAIAGWSQANGLANAKLAFADVFLRLRPTLLVDTAAQLVLLSANLLFLVNFCRTACSCERSESAAPAANFRQPSTLEASAS